ncbi:pA859L [African swine fever virus]|uniref:PA859L n=1 Tax=African swine fever virus TaxID=10497 RepID=A0A8A1V0J9_ASF|nr:pA859L [African swine fever virus]
MLFIVLFFRTSLDMLFITIFICLIPGRSQALFPYVRYFLVFMLAFGKTRPVFFDIFRVCFYVFFTGPIRFLYTGTLTGIFSMFIFLYKAIIPVLSPLTIVLSKNTIKILRLLGWNHIPLFTPKLFIFSIPSAIALRNSGYDACYSFHGRRIYSYPSTLLYINGDKLSFILGKPSFQECHAFFPGIWPANTTGCPILQGLQVRHLVWLYRRRFLVFVLQIRFIVPFIPCVEPQRGASKVQAVVVFTISATYFNRTFVFCKGSLPGKSFAAGTTVYFALRAIPYGMSCQLQQFCHRSVGPDPVYRIRNLRRVYKMLVQAWIFRCQGVCKGDITTKPVYTYVFCVHFYRYKNGCVWLLYLLVQRSAYTLYIVSTTMSRRCKKYRVYFWDLYALLQESTVYYNIGFLCGTKFCICFADILSRQGCVCYQGIHPLVYQLRVYLLGLFVITGIYQHFTSRYIGFYMGYGHYILLYYVLFRGLLFGTRLVGQFGRGYHLQFKIIYIPGLYAFSQILPKGNAAKKFTIFHGKRGVVPGRCRYKKSVPFFTVVQHMGAGPCLPFAANPVAFIAIITIEIIHQYRGGLVRGNHKKRRGLPYPFCNTDRIGGHFYIVVFYHNAGLVGPHKQNVLQGNSILLQFFQSLPYYGQARHQVQNFSLQIFGEDTIRDASFAASAGHLQNGPSTSPQLLLPHIGRLLLLQSILDCSPCLIRTKKYYVICEMFFIFHRSYHQVSQFLLAYQRIRGQRWLNHYRGIIHLIRGRITQSIPYVQTVCNILSQLFYFFGYKTYEFFVFVAKKLCTIYHPCFNFLRILLCTCFQCATILPFIRTTGGIRSIMQPTGQVSCVPNFMYGLGLQPGMYRHVQSCA